MVKSVLLSRDPGSSDVHEVHLPISDVPVASYRHIGALHLVTFLQGDYLLNNFGNGQPWFVEVVV